LRFNQSELRMNMELTNLNYKPLNSVNQGHIRDISKDSGGPGSPVQDYETRKQLKISKKKIERNNKWVYLSFMIEFLVFIIIFISWIMLSQM